MPPVGLGVWPSLQSRCSGHKPQQEDRAGPQIGNVCSNSKAPGTSATTASTRPATMKTGVLLCASSPAPASPMHPHLCILTCSILTCATLTCTSLTIASSPVCPHLCHPHLKHPHLCQSAFPCRPCTDTHAVGSSTKTWVPPETT